MDSFTDLGKKSNKILNKLFIKPSYSNFNVNSETPSSEFSNSSLLYSKDHHL